MTIESLLTKFILFGNSAVVLTSIVDATTTTINPTHYTNVGAVFIENPGLYVSLAIVSVALSVVYKNTQKPRQQDI